MCLVVIITISWYPIRVGDVFDNSIKEWYYTLLVVVDTASNPTLFGAGVVPAVQWRSVSGLV